MKTSDIRQAIESGKTALGVEFGSTRIKAVLIGENHAPIASGSYEWENRYENGVWTYHLDDVWAGLQESYRQLSREVEEKYGVRLQTIGAIGFSGMMHGYLAFDAADNLLAPFRTWRNTMTAQAAEKLTALFQFNIPQRWSIAHLYQAMLNGEAHVREIRFQTTLAGYVHWKLTGQKVLGVGEASGMFPIDSTTMDYDRGMLAKFNDLLKAEKLPFTLEDILPRVLLAGESAGALTAEGARLIDPSGTLRAGIPLCPPEGDAGTGMVATNSVAERTGNVSAGTSVFAMIVLERALSKVYPEIDMVTTPSGKPVAMVHSNNCTSDLNAWVELFQEFTQALGMDVSQSRLFEVLYQQALRGLQREIRLFQRLDNRLSGQFNEIDEEMRLASRIQRDFLPKRLPAVGRAQFATLYRPASWVSGDLYDVLRLDERHVGFYIADAVGHGMPAALLTMFIKRSMETKHIAESGYRLLAPEETMRSLNRALLEAGLSANQFTTAIYAVLDVKTLVVQFARGGHPHPLWLRHDGTVSEPQADGGLLGIFPDAEFARGQFQMAPGDKLILYSDGLETVFVDGEEPTSQAYRDRLRAAAHLPVERMLASLVDEMDRQIGSLNPRDDVTIVAMEIA